jgi:hypothetical protein
MGIGRAAAAMGQGRFADRSPAKFTMPFGVDLTSRGGLLAQRFFDPLAGPQSTLRGEHAVAAALGMY